MIQTPRLILEPLEPTHAEVLLNGLHDQRLYEFINEDPPKSLDALRSRYTKLASRKSPDGTEIWLNWAIRKRFNQNYAGYVQATVKEDRSAEIAYVLFHTEWGNGYAYESVGAMIEHLHQDLSINKFKATVDTRNHRSIRLLLTLKFSHFQYRMDAEIIHGVLTNESEYKLTF